MKTLIDDEQLYVATAPVNMFQMNQYVIVDKPTGDAVIIDAGGKPEPFLEAIDKKNGSLIAIWQTHAHIDHILGLEATKEKTNVPYLLHKEDETMLERSKNHAAHLGVPAPNPPKPDQCITDGQQLTLGNRSFVVLHTPGHAPGHVCFYNKEDELMFGGDLLFRGSIGRTDLPGCNQQDMIKSLRRIQTLPDNTRVFPGHMGPTTIGHEKETNPFLQSI